MNSINIKITGDLFLGGRIESIAKENPESLFDSKIFNLIANAQLNIVNLESPLSNAGTEYLIIKNGPYLKASPDKIGVLDFLKINLVTHANNHNYDFSNKGLSDTLDLCASHNISTVGAGLTLSEASKIFLKKINGITIGILNIAENEESVAIESLG
jgi:poly-gamma-glutamate capsule biosynthesis protein CapA/YwtB (metallophosphatase superfamily)